MLQPQDLSHDPHLVAWIHRHESKVRTLVRITHEGETHNMDHWTLTPLQPLGPACWPERGQPVTLATVHGGTERTEPVSRAGWPVTRGDLRYAKYHLLSTDVRIMPDPRVLIARLCGVPLHEVSFAETDTHPQHWGFTETDARLYRRRCTACGMVWDSRDLAAVDAHIEHCYG